MNTKKKTLYDILAVSPTATQQQIQTTHDSLLASLRAQRALFNAEDYRLKLQMIELAFATLSSTTSRSAYDAELAQQHQHIQATATHSPVAALAVVADPASIALRAEAMSLRAEAISLRADALSIHSQANAFGTTSNRATPGLGGMDAVVSGLRKFLTLAGAVLAVWMVIQVVFMFSSNRRSQADTAQELKANEKVMLQEYYQTYGVRPSSVAQMNLFEAENRRKEAENRLKDNESRAAERAALKAEDDSKRFEEESRRRARDVSAELGFAESQAKEQAQRDEEQKKYQLEEKTRRAEQAEANRIEREKQKWADTLRR